MVSNVFKITQLITGRARARNPDILNLNATVKCTSIEDVSSGWFGELDGKR